MGSKLLEIRGRFHEYTGELDYEGRACGYGVIRWETTTYTAKTVRYEGTFLNDKWEGIGKSQMHSTYAVRGLHPRGCGE